MKIIRVSILTALFLAATGIAAGDEKTSLITAVHSKVLNGYKRTKGADGKFKPEYYALSNGGALPGTLRDSSIEKVEFPQLAGVLGQFLAQQNYHLARDSKSAELLLLVNWGQTTPRLDTNYAVAMNNLSSAMVSDLADLREAQAAENAEAAAKGVKPIELRGTASGAFENALIETSMFGRMRDQANEANARLLGYIDAVNELNDRVPKAGDDNLYALIGDIEEPRYYLIVSAYDFRELVRHSKQKLLWTTRVSIRAPGSSFEKDFAAMLAKASRHFGEDSGGLLRRYDPRGRVDIGEIEVLGMTPGAPEKK